MMSALSQRIIDDFDMQDLVHQDVEDLRSGRRTKADLLRDFEGTDPEYSKCAAAYIEDVAAMAKETK
jgi:hypothetical protein